MGRKNLGEERRAQILDAFYRCAARDGLHGASIRKIAAEAGVRPGIIHHYFSSREEMIEELVVGIAELHTAEFRKSLGSAKSPKTRYERAVDFLFGPELLGDETGSMFYDFWAEAKRNEKVRKSFSRVYRGFRETIIDLLSETGMADDLKRSEVKDLASVIIAIYEGVYLQWDMDRDNVPLSRIKKLARKMIEGYMGGGAAGGGEK